MKVQELYIQLKNQTEGIVIIEYSPRGDDDKVCVFAKNGRDRIFGTPQTILDRIDLSDEEMIRFAVAWVNASLLRAEELHALTRIRGRVMRNRENRNR